MKIYLLQVYPELRDTKERLYKGGMMAFTRPDLAEDWAKTNYPIWLNPFTNASTWDDANDDALIYFYENGTVDPPLAREHTASLQHLNTLVKSLDLPLPSVAEGFAEEVWRDWWDANQATMTHEQKTALWRFLVPQPYDLIALDLE